MTRYLVHGVPSFDKIRPNRWVYGPHTTPGVKRETSKFAFVAQSSHTDLRVERLEKLRLEGALDRLLPRAQVIMFFALLQVIDDSSATVLIGDRLSYLTGLFGVSI